MWIMNSTASIGIFLMLLVMIVNLNYVQTRRTTYRVRTKGGTPILPPFLLFSPPRASSAQNFHSSDDPSSFLMPSQMSYNSIGTDYGPPSQEYGPPSLTQEYGPPPSQSYGPPPSQSYGPPSSQPFGPPPSQSYGPPTSPSQSYGPPAAEYGPPTMKPLIHKHIYVHIPPPEPENLPTRTPLTTAAPQKHYRIVFIKAPTEAPVTLPSIPVQPPDEEKTLVYVLVKKPDEIPELVLPKPASTTPSKPEVYFIRYKAQTESDDGPYPASNSNSNSNGNSYPSSGSSSSSSSSSSNTYRTFPTSTATLGPPLAVFGQKNRFNTPKK